jgi:hypothetical protein
MHLPAHHRATDLAVLLTGTAVWVAIADRVLSSAGSSLPRVARKRLGIA